MRDEKVRCPGAGSLSRLTDDYLLWAEAEATFSPETIQKRKEALKQIRKVLGERQVSEISKDDLLVLKRELLRRGLSPSTQCGLLYALRSFLAYCRDERGFSVFSPEDIGFP